MRPFLSENSLFARADEAKLDVFDEINAEKLAC